MDQEIKLKKENIVYKSEARKAIYYSLLKCPDGIIRLYSNRWVKYHNTIFVESRDGINFGIEKNIILQKTGASHNFSPFYGRKNKLYGVGGIDNWKHDKNFHGIKKYSDFKKVYEEKFQWSCTKEIFDLAEHKKLLSNKKILSHVRGIYLFESEDGIKWKEVYSKPIITTKNEGYIDAIKNFGKGSEFDGLVNCIYDNITDQYFLYVRANVNPGFRYIQYSTSKDLINWKGFKLINIEGYEKDKDNYYIPCMMKYRNIFIGLTPYFDQEGSCCIKLLKSLNGIDWQIKTEFFNEKSKLFKGEKPKNTCHAVYGFYFKKGIINLYIHHNNLGLDSMKPVNVIRYTILEKEFDKVLELC